VYELVRIAEGGVTVEQSRRTTAERVRKHRTKRKAAKGSSVTVTDKPTKAPEQSPSAEVVKIDKARERRVDAAAPTVEVVLKEHTEGRFTVTAYESGKVSFTVMDVDDFPHRFPLPGIDTLEDLITAYREVQKAVRAKQAEDAA
jgi:hypothetical protein